MHIFKFPWYLRIIKGTVMQIEKALINDHLGVSKVPLKISHSSYL